MQVACDSCGATYEFAASAIPADGYDAQCTGCGHVFFVAPERLEPTVSVTCGSCHTVYRFAASAIPHGGYDAQCTQCQAVFFVPSPSGSEPGGPAQDGEPGVDSELVPAAGLPVLAGTEPVVAGGPPPLAEPRGTEPAASPAGTAALPVGEEPALEEETEIEPERREASDAAEGGEARGAAPGANAPASSPTENAIGAAPAEAAAGATGDVSAPANVHPAHPRSRRALLAGSAATLLAVAGIAVYVAAPSLREARLARGLGLGHTLPPAAEHALAHARELLLADSPAALDGALAEADRVRLAAPRDATAVATAALVHAVRALDAADEARRLRDQAGRAVEAARAAPALSAEQQVRGHELRRAATEAASLPRAALERADSELAACARLSAVGLELDPRSWRVALAAAYCAAADPATMGGAEALLQRSVELRGATLDLGSPPDGWTPMLRALLWAGGPGDHARVREALSAALAKEPRLQHARLALARELLLGGEASAARRLVSELVAAVPDHGAARALLASLEPAPAAVAPAARSPAEQQPAARAKKRKGKRRR